MSRIDIGVIYKEGSLYRGLSLHDFVDRYTAPDGTDVHLQYVADENGFQPQGDHLPVAPEFPHPIPDFVLEQIAFAAEEDARQARGEVSRSYGAPHDD